MKHSRYVPLLALLTIAGGLCAVPSGLGCNDYELLIHDHFAQASFSNRVDVLWVVDNSHSMAQDQLNLQESFGSFIDAMAAPAVTDDEGEAVELDSLTDTVSVYEEFLKDRTRFLDYQMGVTTTQSLPCNLDPQSGTGCEDSVGTAGRLRSLFNNGNDVAAPPTFLYPDSPRLAEDFRALVDVRINGSAEEHGLWVAVETICASLELPFDSDLDPATLDPDFPDYASCDAELWPDDHPWTEFCGCIPQEHHDYNIDGNGQRFLRDDSTLLVVIVSDEGDYTTNMGYLEWPWDISDCILGGAWPNDVREECGDKPDQLCPEACKIERFMDFFDTVDRRVVFAVIGPGVEFEIDDDGNRQTTVECNDQNSTTESLETYLWATELTGGFYAPIAEREDGGECTEAIFDDHLSRLGDLVSNLARGWSLSGVPSLDSMYVFVDGDRIPPAECLPDDESCVPGAYFPTCTGDPEPGLNGWAYDETQRNIIFHGDCVPNYNQIVDVYYLPESGAGRPLPM